MIVDYLFLIPCSIVSDNQFKIALLQPLNVSTFLIRKALLGILLSMWIFIRLLILCGKPSSLRSLSGLVSLIFLFLFFVLRSLLFSLMLVSSSCLMGLAEGYFSFLRGIRHGVSLSLLLLGIAKDYLSRLSLRLVFDNKLKPISIG